MLAMLRPLLLAVACAAACLPSLAAADPALLIGYENEGEIDASAAACEATVRELVEWSEAEVAKATQEVCLARRQHVDAYAALQASYAALAKHLAEDGRLDPDGAKLHLQQMIKECIDHKSALTTGGHNIRLDIIPNAIAAECLTLGKQLVDSEAGWFAGGSPRLSP